MGGDECGSPADGSSDGRGPVDPVEVGEAEPDSRYALALQFSALVSLMARPYWAGATLFAQGWGLLTMAHLMLLTSVPVLCRSWQGYVWGTRTAPVIRTLLGWTLLARPDRSLLRTSMLLIRLLWAP